MAQVWTALSRNCQAERAHHGGPAGHHRHRLCRHHDGGPLQHAVARGRLAGDHGVQPGHSALARVFLWHHAARGRAFQPGRQSQGGHHDAPRGSGQRALRPGAHARLGGLLLCAGPPGATCRDHAAREALLHHHLAVDDSRDTHPHLQAVVRCRGRHATGHVDLHRRQRAQHRGQLHAHLRQVGRPRAGAGRRGVEHAGGTLLHGCGLCGGHAPGQPLQGLPRGHRAVAHQLARHCSRYTHLAARSIANGA